MFAALTTAFWLSVFLSATASVGLILGGALIRRFLVLALGVVGLLASAGWLILGLYVEAVVR